MKFLRIIMLPIAMACTLAKATALESGLPVWKDGERSKMEKDGGLTGGILLTGEPLPGEPEDPTVIELDVAQPTVEEMAGPEAPPVAIPEKFWPEYFAEKPKSFLIDPQGLLSPADYRERLGFLNYHAGDSSIDLYVYVFKGDQEIPGEVREEELIERFFSHGRPAAVVYYYLSAPQRSVLYLSPSLTDKVPAIEQRRALESSMMQAVTKPDPSSQIEAFLVQMSIRIYWMERMMGGSSAADEAFTATTSKTREAAKKPSLLAKLQPFIDRAKPFVIPAAGLLGLLVAALVAAGWLRRAARYRFPEFEVEPRLGGTHAAGVGAVISFASAALPPASQKDQAPDYLRRC